MELFRIDVKWSDSTGVKSLVQSTGEDIKAIVAILQEVELAVKAGGQIIWLEVKAGCPEELNTEPFRDFDEE